MALNKTIIWIVLVVILSFNVFAIGTGDLVTYFTYDDADLTGNDPDDVHGTETQTNNGATTGETGKLDQAFLCEATDYLTLTNPLGTSAYSINMWINPDSTTNSKLLMGLYDGSNHDIAVDWSQVFPENIRVYIDGAWRDNATAQGWTTGSFQMLTITYGSGSMKLYRNGVLTLNSGGLSDADATANDMKICTRGDLTTTSNFEGDIDELAVFDVALSQSDIDDLYNSGSGLAYPFGGAPVAASNSTTEQTSFFEQVGTVSVNSNSYQDIFSGTIEVLNTTQAYSSYTINLLPTNADTFCRAVVDGTDYGTETFRSGTSGDYGVMFFQSDNFSLTPGNYTSTLQCRRNGTGTFVVSNSVGIVHLLKSSNNVEINHTFGELYAESSGTSQNKSTYSYNVQSNVTGSKTLQLIAEGDLTYIYDSGLTDYQEILNNITFNGVACGQYQRSGQSNNVGSGGFACLLPNASGVEEINLTFQIEGTEAGKTWKVNSTFVIKELVLNPSSSNHTVFEFDNINSATYTDIKSITINNSGFPSANLVAKAGLGITSDSTATEIDTRLKITSENGSTLHRDVPAKGVNNIYGLTLNQWVFSGLNQGIYTVTLQAKCDNADCETGGGDLVAYLTDNRPFAATSINVTVKDFWSNVSLSNFSVMTSDGTTFSTETNFLQVFTANDPENLTIIKPNYFNKTYLNQNLSSVLAATIYQSEVSFTATQLITGAPLSGATFFINGNENTVFKLNASTHDVVATKEGYWNKTNQITTTPLQNGTVTFANMSNAIVNITLVEYVSGNPVLNFTVITDYGVTLNTTNGYVELPILQNISTRYINISNTLGGLFASVKDVPVTANKKNQNLTVYAYTFNSVLLTVYDADTQAILLNPNVSYSVISNVTSYSNVTVNGTALEDFLAPTDYELRFNATGYNPRSLFITVLNDSTQNVSVYLTSNVSAELQTVEVVSTANEFVEGAVVWLQKEIIGGATQFITVQEAKTDFEGKTTVWVERDTTVFYRFAVIVNGTARPILPNRNTFTGKTSFIPAVTETIQIIIDLEEAQSQIIDNRLGISTNLYFNDTPTGAPNNNNTVFFEWVDGKNTISGATLEIWGRFMLNSSNYELVNSQTISLTSGIMNYSFTPINNTIYEIRGYITTNGKSELYELAIKKFDVNVVVDENTGLLYAVFLLVVVSLLSLPFQRQIGKSGVVVSGVLTFGSLFIVTKFQIVDIPVAVITSLIAFVIIVFGVFKKNE